MITIRCSGLCECVFVSAFEGIVVKSRSRASYVMAESGRER